MPTRDIVYIALFAAVTAALGLFPPFPLPVTGVPITLQSMGPLLAGAILGAKRGLLSQLLFVVLVIVGLPLLAGGRGGFGIIVGPTGGFFLAWPVMALFVGFFVERYWRDLTFVKALAICLIASIVISYLIGTPWMAVVLGLGPVEATAAILAFVPGDIAKAVVAALIGMTVRRAYPIITKEKSPLSK